MQVAKTNDLQKCASCREDSISGGDAASPGRNDFMLDVLLDTVLDSVRLLPFIFLTYLLMEALEHPTGTCVGRSARCDSAVRVFGSGIESFCRKSHYSRNAGRHLFVHFG